MATVAGFQSAYPEFAATDQQRLVTLLAEVDERVSSSFGSLRDRVIYLEMADTLASSTAGRNARRTKDGSGASVYATKLHELQTIHAASRRT